VLEEDTAEEDLVEKEGEECMEAEREVKGDAVVVEDGEDTAEENKAGEEDKAEEGTLEDGSGEDATEEENCPVALLAPTAWPSQAKALAKQICGDFSPLNLCLTT
jgi:hypothetical protein